MIDFSFCRSIIRREGNQPSPHGGLAGFKLEKTMQDTPTIQDADQLTADIASTNHGYLFAPTGWQLRIADAYTDRFITRLNAFRRTTIYIRTP